MHGFIKIRIKATGQVTEMIENVARAMLNAGTAEPVLESDGKSITANHLDRLESAAVEPAAERAVTPAQNGPAKKKFFNRKSA